MSKKLIAVASAAALALSAFVALPSMATPAAAFSVTPSNGVGGGGSATDPHKIDVPSSDVIREDGTETVVELLVLATVANAQIKVDSSSPSVKLLTATQALDLTKLNSTSGAQSITVTSDADGGVEVFVTTTTTSKQTVTVTQVGTANSSVVHIQGLSDAENAYKLNFTASSTTAPSGNVEFAGTVVDMFGNVLEMAQDDFNIIGLGGNLDGTGEEMVTNSYEVDEDTFAIKFAVQNRDSAGSAAFSLVLNDPAEEIKRFGSVVDTQFFTVNALDLSAQVTALTAQVAALQAQLADSRPKARSVTKKRFNTLARKWNAANPSARVTLKK